MKKTLLFLSLFFWITFSYSQNDCSQGDGTFRYGAHLSIANVPTDFDKDDFINYIVGLDNISNGDLTILTEQITSVYKTFPSQNPHKSITIIATLEIYSILNDLENSIEFHYCIVRDCTLEDGTFSYLPLLANGPISNDFDKIDFITYITAFDTISIEDLETLNTNITFVYKAFPSSQSGLLQRVVVVDALVDIYSILESLVNSIEYIECNSDDIILEINDTEISNYSMVYPNPITEASVIKLNINSVDFRLELINSLGQTIYHEKISGKNIIPLKNLPIDNGITFLKIYDYTNGTIETLKILKEK